jgi:uncharacterized membrane protein
MNLQPLIEAPLAIQIHVATVVPAFILGTWQFALSHKGSPAHRAVGALYLALMTITSISAIFITAVVGPTFMGFGLIHLLVLLTLFSVWNAIRGIQTGNIPRHRRAVMGSYLYGIVIAGALTFIPGRIMAAVVFG